LKECLQAFFAVIEYFVLGSKQCNFAWELWIFVFWEFFD
jgi:hypothetical protein